MVLGVKIRDNNTGLFRLKDGRWSKNGKTYSTLGFAKSAITCSLGCKYEYIKKFFNYDFLILKDDCSIEALPVKYHVTEHFNKKLKSVQKQLEYFEQQGYTADFKYDEVRYIEEILKNIEKEGKENE